VRFVLRHFIAIAAIISVASYVAIYRFGPPIYPIRSDGYSYYVYLPSWILFGDIGLEGPARDCCGGTYPAFTSISRLPATGRWINPHPIGVAVLTLPFFATAHVLTRWSNLPPDGFSMYYQHAAGLAGLCYALVGLALLRKILAAHFAAAVVVATLAIVFWGTNLFHYAVYESTFSHPFSFCLAIGFLMLTDRWWREPTRATSAWIGAVAGLMILTRHTNAVFLALLPLYGVNDWDSLQRQAGAVWDRRRLIALSTVVAVACVLPQLGLYRYASGEWIVNAYDQTGLTFGSPKLFGVLFSVQKGLFFWSPVLLLGLAGLFLARGWSRRLVAATAFILVVQTLLIASWGDWQFGGSFGHRGFVDNFGLLAVFIATCMDRISARPVLRVVVGAAAAAAVALSVAQTIQYWNGILPSANTTWEQYRELFLRFE
jgi:hypothetical protein